MLPGFEDVRERIVRRRKQVNLTQAELADKADVSQSFVAKLERGQSTPNYEAVARLYNTLEEMIREEEQTASEIMTSYVVTLDREDTVKYASSIMRREDYSQIPVTDDSGRSIGTVTSMSVIGADAEDPVEDYMDTSLPEVPEDTSKTAVSELLKTADAVLVQRSEDGIIGIITATDIL